MTKPVDVVGQRFGRYVVISNSSIRTKAKKQMVYCRCDCGTERLVTVGNLRSGISESCGCLKSEKTRLRRTKHGLSQTTMYLRYRGMIRRCYMLGSPEFHNYGARGIKVCARWLESVENYIQDMGQPPFEWASVDRIDNSGDYCKDNCRWASKKEQSLNRRTTNFIEFNGETLCVSDWAKKIGLSNGGLRNRLLRGMSVEDALTR